MEPSNEVQVEERPSLIIPEGNVPPTNEHLILSNDHADGNIQVQVKAPEKKKKSGGSGSILKLFSFARAIDWLLMAIGLLAAIAHGAILPASMFFFGEMINLYVFHNLTAETWANVTGTIPNSQDPNCTVVTNIARAVIQNATNLPPAFTSLNFICRTESEFFLALGNYLYAFFGLAMGSFLLGFIQVFTFSMAAKLQVHRIRKALFKAILRQNVAWFDENKPGELNSRLVDDLIKVQDGIGDKLSIFFQLVATFFTAFILGFAIEWRLTLLMLGCTPFLAVSAFFFTKLLSIFTSKEQKEYAVAGAVAEEVLSSVKTVKAFGGEEKELMRYCEQLKSAKLLGAKKGALSGTAIGVIYLVIFGVYALALWFSALLIGRGYSIPGDSITVFFAVLIGAFSIGQAAPSIGEVGTAAGAMGFIYATIHRVPPIDVASSAGETPSEAKGKIELKSVFFNYPSRPDVIVLDGIDIEANVGETLALVGPSGCGKSTVVQLLQRFYDIDSGTILMDGKDINTLNVKWLRSQIGFVSQEPVLFATTIAENIRYGREGVTQEEIEAAARAANAHDFIMSLPNKYETLAGERGAQISGGQKQRIAIARALVRDPKILLLDEATSALDAESEAIVQDALDKARRGRTTIVIAHRLSTIRSADKIAVFHQGQVVELGTHQSLMEEEGVYYSLVTAQTGGDLQEELEAFVVSPTRVRQIGEEDGFPPFERQTSHQSGIVRVGSRKVGLDRQGSKLDRQDSVKKADTEEDTQPEKKDLSEKELAEYDKQLEQVGLLPLLKLNAREWPFIALGILGSFIEGVAFPLFAIFFGEVLSVFTSTDPESEVALWSGLLFLLGVVSGIGIFMKTFCFTVAGEFLTARIRELVFKAMLRQDMEFFDNKYNTTGALSTRLANDAAQVQGATGARLGVLFQVAFSLLLSIAIAFAYSWSLTLLLFGFIPILMITGALQLKAITGFTEKNKKDLEEAGKISVESIGNIRTVASLGKETTFYELYCIQVNQIHKRSMIGPVLAGIMYGISQGTLFLGYILVFGYGSWQVTRPTNHVAFAPFDRVFVVFNALIFGAVGAGQAGAFAPNYAKARVSANRIFAMIKRVPKIDVYSEEGERGMEVSGNIEVKDVRFTYPSRPDALVLKGLSIDVQQGKTLALVGPSGCGKSTIVSLIERFYDPDTTAEQPSSGEPTSSPTSDQPGNGLEKQLSIENPMTLEKKEPPPPPYELQPQEPLANGELHLDGKDLRSLNLKWLRQQIGLVSQEPVLFDASIADNIRYGAHFREVSDEEVEEAAKASNIHDFIMGLPLGYDTNVGSRGTQISGGQKQRIAIARALVRDPKILLLDEATSALDAESEAIVQDALDKASQGRTTIIIAHRLSTIQNADTIAVIKGGKVAEKGTHSELLNSRGIYYRLNQAQLIKK
jgi:ABC-type multidrug transport system fused ATPase/permease subunit